MFIADAIRGVRERIYNSAIRSGRDPDEVRLIAVTKTIDVARIIEAMEAGITVFGENRVQEALKKIQDPMFRIEDKGIEWHLIGTLQRNKAKYAVRLFELIHSIDSLSLAEEVNRQAERLGRVQKVLVQVRLSDEETKHGITRGELIPLIEGINGLKNIRLEGLMTIPPYFDDPERTRQYFRSLREIRDNINALRITPHALRELSMGMSHDFEVAIEEGATMVRIGTAIFGERR
ncbi:MAG: YggS family pyridoxal phosphate-dependent enzyme [Thermodesulfovibrionia bacterium]